MGRYARYSNLPLLHRRDHANTHHLQQEELDSALAYNDNHNLWRKTSSSFTTGTIGASWRSIVWYNELEDSEDIATNNTATI